MRHPFKHPLATHSALCVLGYRRNGAPIYAIAGGNGEGGGAAGSPSGGDGGQPSGQSGSASGSSGQGSGQQPPVSGSTGSGQGGSPSGQGPDPAGDGTDWKTEARKWEKRAKDNSGAAEELEKLKQQSMSDQEKAVTEAEKRGRTAAAVDHGRELAAARFEAAAAQAGVNLGEAAELINTAQFVNDKGQVDGDAITAAVKKLAKLAPKGPGRSGADLSGGHGDTPPSVDKQIAEATAKGDWRTAMRLQNSKLPGLAAAQNQ